MELSWWLLNLLLFSMETSAEAPLAQTPLLDSAVAGQDVRFAGAGIMTLQARWARRNIAVIVSTSPFLHANCRSQSDVSPKPVRPHRRTLSPAAFQG